MKEIRMWGRAEHLTLHQCFPHRRHQVWAQGPCRSCFSKFVLQGKKITTISISVEKKKKKIQNKNLWEQDVGIHLMRFLVILIHIKVGELLLEVS